VILIKILDCTFRDGGYYNLWDFDSSLVRRYLHAVTCANINTIELGFRNFPQDKFLGAFAYTTDAYVDSLDIDKNISVGVMINASKIFNSSFSIDDAINILFQSKQKSRVDLVRIAASINDIDQCYQIARSLTKLGYKVGLNLMQPNDVPSEEISRIAGVVQKWKTIDVLYFADSLGGMNATNVVRIILALKTHWTGELGFHAHNNKGLAASNTMVALENGATWVDCTILGMGRGAGNAQTENLLLALQEKYQLGFDMDVLFDLVLSDFIPLQKKYHWGEGLLYNLAAINNIHPTYIQEMLVEGRYSNKEILKAIDFMAPLNTKHYDKDLLLHAQGNTKNKGSWNAKDWCLGKEVLILGSGKSLNIYQDAIIQYIELHQPVVISINIKSSFPERFIDVYTSSNESKMLIEYDLYTQTEKPVVIPKLLLEKVLNKLVANIKILKDYGLNIKENTFISNEKECTLPYELSIGYALSLAKIGKSREISLVGFDGYEVGDSRQDKTNELFALFRSQSTQTLTALTPSTYLKILQSSIYANKDIC
jgi:4-hydroxy 2-oxovalerate aldolase